MKQNTNKKKGIAKKAISVSLVAAMLATTNVPVWAAGDSPIVVEGSADTLAASATALAGSISLTSAGVAVTEAAWGATLTVNTDKLENKADNAPEYTWYADGEAISGQTAETLNLTSDMFNKTITASVNGSVLPGADIHSEGVKVIGKTVLDTAITVTFNSEFSGAHGVTVDASAKTIAFAGDASTFTPVVDSVAVTDGTSQDITYFTVSDPGVKNPGDTGEFVVSFDGLYKGSVTYNCSVAAADITGAAVNLTKNSQDKKSTEIAYAPTTDELVENVRPLVVNVIDKDGKVISPDNYVLSFDTPANAGSSATLKVTGQGAYSGSVTATVNVVAKDINDATVTVEPIAPQELNAVTPVLPVVKDGNTPLTKDTHYTLSYGENLTPGPQSGSVIIKGSDNYTGTRTETFDIKGAELTDLEASFGTSKVNENVIAASYSYTGKAVEPLSTRTVFYDDSGIRYSLGTDFTVSYKDNINKGTATVVFTGAGVYLGDSFEKTFEITPFDLSALTAENITAGDIPYNSSVKDAATAEAAYGKLVNVEVSLNGTKLVKGTDYKVEYTWTDFDSNPSATEIPYEISNVSDNFTNTKAGNVKIAAASLEDAIIAAIPQQTYTGSAITPTVAVTLGAKTLTLGTDYTVSYKDNKDPGTATVTVIGKGNYTGTKTSSFVIAKVAANVKIMYATTPSDPSTYTDTLPALRYDRTTAGSTNGITYPTNNLVVVAVGDKDLTRITTGFDLEYANNKTKTTAATITVKSQKGYDYTGSATFEIKGAILSGSFTGAISAKPYTGDAVVAAETDNIKWTPTDNSLVEGKDYKFEYANNINASDKAEYRVVGLGNYQDPQSVNVKYFEISKAAFAPANVVVADGIYNGGLAVEPAVTVYVAKDGKVLTQGTDYTVDYSTKRAVMPGDEGTVTVNLSDAIKDNFNGSTADAHFTVGKADLKDTAVVSEIKDVTFEGKPVEPAFDVTVGAEKLVKDTDYTVEYKDNDKVGKATIIITAIAESKKFTGSKEVNFNIVEAQTAPEAPANVKASSNATSITVSWNAVDGATGYVIYEYAKADLKTITKRYAVTGTSKTIKYNPGTVRTFVVRAYKTIEGKNVYCKAADAIANKVAASVKPSKTDIKSVVAGKGTAKVTTIPGKGAIGAAYCISYDGGKTYKIIAKGPKGITTPNYTMKGLKKGAAVVKIRGYVKDHNGKTIYGDWSKAVKVTIK